MRKTLPKKEDGNWYIRPHHIDELTHHTQSIKSDVLNTRYYSHYNQEHGKKQKVDKREQAIGHIEGMLERLRSQQVGMAALKGKDDFEEMEKLKV